MRLRQSKGVIGIRFSLCNIFSYALCCLLPLFSIKPKPVLSDTFKAALPVRPTVFALSDYFAVEMLSVHLGLKVAVLIVAFSKP